jgi:predicted CXXCH cytochrome family protein
MPKAEQRLTRLLLNCGAMLMAGMLPAQEAAFVGSRVCAGCHRAIYLSYMRTDMGRSMRRASDLELPTPVDLEHAHLHRRFRVFWQGNKLYQSEYAVDASGNQVFDDIHEIEFAIGSGVNGFSFVVRRGNYLFEAPLSYYAKSSQWDFSPGYESADLGFSRPVAATCVGCHSGRARLIAGRDGLYDNVPFDELAIGCENCHGPGALHVAQRKPSAIVNPARLPPRLAEEICVICHQMGDARVVVSGKRLSDFRPGMWSSEVVAIFKLPSSQAEPSDLLEHPTAMRTSRCFRASGGKLSCLTCHDPHATPVRTEAAAYYRSKCFTCHADASCGVPQSERQQRAANNCIACHMPKRDVTVVSHSALTNHRIPARSGQEPVQNSSGVSSAGDLIVVNGSPNSKPSPVLTMFLAYGQLVANRTDFAPRYWALLDQLSHTRPDDAVVLAALGMKMMFDPNPDNMAAQRYFEKAIERGSTAPSTFQSLAEVLVRSGQREQAIAVLEQGLALSPYAAVLYESLARTYNALGRPDEVRKTVARYLELFPEDDAARRLLH